MCTTVNTKHFLQLFDQMTFSFILVVISPAKAKIEKPNKNGLQKVEEDKDWELVPPDGIY